MPVMCSQNWNYIKSNSSQGSAGGMNFLPDNVVLPMSCMQSIITRIRLALTIIRTDVKPIANPALTRRK